MIYLVICEGHEEVFFTYPFEASRDYDLKTIVLMAMGTLYQKSWTDVDFAIFYVPENEPKFLVEYSAYSDDAVLEPNKERWSTKLEWERS